jgi:hypothetical protein
MDDEQYRQTRDAIDLPPCLYGKALQYGYFTCQHARNITLGEREAVHCQNECAYANCKRYYTLTLEKSGFALGAPHLPAHLTFNKAMQVQIGGMQGAMRLCKKTSSAPDISDCLMQLISATAEFKHLNFSVVMPFIQAFSLRKRGRDRPS